MARADVEAPTLNLCFPTKDKKQTLLDAIASLTGMELLEMREEINSQFKKVIDREENFFLHDYLDEWLYIVSYRDGSEYLYTKGADAYAEYKRTDFAIAITRKSKDLFPTYQVMMSKGEFAYIPKKGEKVADMSKKDYDMQYQKEHVKRVYFVLNKASDKDIVDFLAKQDNVNGFLKELVRDYMKKEGTE